MNTTDKKQIVTRWRVGFAIRVIFCVLLVSMSATAFASPGCQYLNGQSGTLGASVFVEFLNNSQPVNKGDKVTVTESGGNTLYIGSFIEIANSGSAVEGGSGASADGIGNTGTSTVSYSITCVSIAPTLTGITPAVGTSGSTVTLTGTGFYGSSAVKFGTQAATSFTVNNATSITATVPAGTGTQVITVTTDAATTTATNVTYTYTLNLVVMTALDDATGVAENCPGPNCSLRDALAAASVDSMASITFDPTVFSAATTINLSSALTVASNVSIVGPTGAPVTLSGQGQVQVMTVNSGVTASISDLTIADGNNQNRECTNGQGTALAAGGGICNMGTLTVASSTITGNNSTFSGGGICNLGTLTVTNSTIAGNNSGDVGGGIFQLAGVSTVTNSTISGNGAPNGGSGIDLASGTLSMTNSIVSGNTGEDCSSDGGTACPTNGSNGNLIGGTVALAALGYYGGPTQTAPPLPDSTALQAGTYQSDETTMDQRGALRPSISGASIDAGAVQVTGDVPMIGSVTPNSGSVAGGTSVTITGTGFDAATGSGNVLSAVNFGATPTTSFTVNAANGTTPASITAVSPAEAAGTVMVTVTNSVGTSAATSVPATNDQFTYYVPVVITKTSLPNATLEASYNESLTATGGSSGSYVWTASSGSLPAGLSLSGSGSSWMLSGTPTTTGSYTFTLTATDSAISANRVSQSYTISVLATVNFTFSNPTSIIGGQAAAISVNFLKANGLSTYPAGMVNYAIGSACGTTTPNEPAFISTNTGMASVQLPTNLTAGAYVLSISYGGDTNYAANNGCDDFIVSATMPGAPAIGVAAAGNEQAVVTFVAPVSDGGASITSYTARSSPGNFIASGAASPITVNGLVNGTTYTFTVTATNSAGTGAASAASNNVTPKGVQTITFAKPGSPSFGSSPTLPATASSGLPVTFSSSTPAVCTITSSGVLTIVKVGSCTVNADQTGNAAFTAATQVSQSFTIGQAQTTVTLGNLSQTYTGLPLPVTATTAPTGLMVNFTYTGRATAPTAAGSYTVVGTISDANYTGTATGTLVIGKVTLTVAAHNASRIYGTANPAFTGTVNGQQNGDTFIESFNTTAGVGSAVGSTYSIVPSVMGTNLNDYTQLITDGTLAITQAVSSIGLSTGNGSITPGQSVTLNAVVADATSGSTGTPTGSVSFYDGTTLLGMALLNGGTAMYTASTLAPGVTHALAAVYGGDGNFIGSSTASSVAVTAAPLDFTLTRNSAGAQTVVPGNSVSYTFGLSPLYGSYAGPVSFTVTGLPTGATATFSPATIAANAGAQPVTLTISTPAATAQNYTERNMSLFALLLVPLSVARRSKGMMRQLCLLLLILGGAATALMLTGCGTSSNGFFAQAQQSYTVTITATSGTLQHSSTITLIVE